MYETKGNSSLFDCVEKSVMNLINYSVAITIAINTSIGKALGWKLEKEESKNRWEYRFHIWSDKNWVARISTPSRVVLRIA